MEAGALGPYERALAAGGGLGLAVDDGSSTTLDVGRWLADVDDADATVLARCRGPVLDVGCGPGRFVSALARLGVPALGVDIATLAVALTRDRGAPVLERSVFAPLPGEGRWPTVLLLDGNIGIGGAPDRLLRRGAHLLSHDGLLVVETEAERPEADRVLRARFSESGRVSGPTFGWAQVGTRTLRRIADPAGLCVAEEWSTDGRSFTSLARHRTG